MSGSAVVLIGTSGWSYPEWRGVFYPDKLPARGHLRYYAGHFNSVEVNATFYGLPLAATVAGWQAQIPPGFVMAVKASQLITHRLRLQQGGPAIAEFMQVMQGLGPALGPVLFQVPPTLPVDVQILHDFLSEVRTVIPDLGQRLVVEFRHKSWYTPAVFAALSDFACALCAHDLPDSGLAAPDTGPFLYLRRHGTTGRYAGAYSQAALQDDATLVLRWLAAGRSAFVYFNNTRAGDALHDARLLRTLVERG